VKFVAGEFDVRCTDVLLEAVQLGRPRNRHNPRLLRQQPRERHLSWGRPFAQGDAVQHLHEPPSEHIVGFSQ
jgi:hypothetical protein